MIQPSSNGGQTYRVEMSTAIRESILKLQQQATREGRGKECFRAFEQILNRIEKQPHSTGEPLYHLQTLKMQVRETVVAPLAVHFAVCDDRQVIYIKRVILMSR